MLDRARRGRANASIGTKSRKPSTLAATGVAAYYFAARFAADTVGLRKDTELASLRAVAFIVNAQQAWA